jgi:hypothetical protein
MQRQTGTETQRGNSHRRHSSIPSEHELRSTIAVLRDEEANLQEEVRQLRAAVQIYNEVVARLAERTGHAAS